MSAALPDLSVVIPVCNEVDNVAPLAREVAAALRPRRSFELIFVDDGSTDGTFEVLKKLARAEPRIRAFQLAANVGSQRALLLGLEKARGDVMICIDADLQQPPELLPQMLDAWRSGFEVVHMVRNGRSDESLARVLATRVFYGAFNVISRVPIVRDAADFKLLSRSCVDVLVREQPRFLRAAVHALAVKQTSLTYEAAPRRHGESRYDAQRLIKAGLQALVPTRLQPRNADPRIVGVIP